MVYILDLFGFLHYRGGQCEAASPKVTHHANLPGLDMLQVRFRLHSAMMYGYHLLVSLPLLFRYIQLTVEPREGDFRQFSLTA